MADALPALHARSGCDATSAFYGVGKKKIYTVIKNADHYKEALAQFGNNHTFDRSLFPCYSADGCRVLQYPRLQ